MTSRSPLTSPPAKKCASANPPLPAFKSPRELNLPPLAPSPSTAAALQTQPSLPQWTLLPAEHSLQCQSGQLQFDLGAIGKALRLTAWPSSCSVGIAPPSCSSPEAAASLPATRRRIRPAGPAASATTTHPMPFFLTHTSLRPVRPRSQGKPHPRSPHRQSRLRQHRAWALADTAAESDALSIACMVLTGPELEEVLTHDSSWLFFLETDPAARPMGSRPLPPNLTQPAGSCIAREQSASNQQVFYNQYPTQERYNPF